MRKRTRVRGMILASLSMLALTGCAEANATSDTGDTGNETVPVTGAGIATRAKPDIIPNPNLPPLPIEPIGRVATLSADFPESWMYIDEISFANMFGGKIILMDITETRPAKRIKAMADKALIGNFTQSKSRNEFYIMETFHERGARGKRTDVLAIYDKTTFNIVEELLWDETGTVRVQAMPQRYSMTLTADERFLLVSNFSPAASFTVVDPDTREIVTTIGTPGCVLTYPTGKNGVSSLCNNGSMLTTVLDKNGYMKSQYRLAPFFDTDKTPIYERPAIVDGIAYFPSFAGLIHVIDLRGEVAEYLETWNLVSAQEQQRNWRPSGVALIDKDEQGLVYILMNPDGHDGTQTHGSNHVWVFDMAGKKRVRTIDVPNFGISLAVSRGNRPKLVVTNGDMNLDVLDAESGELIQTISDFGNTTPLLINKAY